MALTGDHYVGMYHGHAVELIRNNWDKTLKLLIDGEEVASTTCHLPGRRMLTGSLEHGGVHHDVVAKSVPRYLVLTEDTIEIDGDELPLTYQAPRGITPVWVVVLGIIGAAVLLAVGGGLLLGQLP